MPAETARLTPSRSSSASERGRETKERLLDAAERLFGERGFEGASMRAVTQEAGTSVSAANYHFGSKEALLRATLLRRVEPVNRRRIDRLDALEREAQGKPLPLERILEAFLRPLFEERASRAEGPAEYRQVAARLYSDPPELVASMKRELFGSLIERFMRAFSRALPDRSAVEIGLAFEFVVGAMVHVMSGHLAGAPSLERVDVKARAEALSDEAVLDYMIAFMAFGLRAPRGKRP